MLSEPPGFSFAAVTCANVCVAAYVGHDVARGADGGVTPAETVIPTPPVAVDGVALSEEAVLGTGIALAAGAVLAGAELAGAVLADGLPGVPPAAAVLLVALPLQAAANKATALTATDLTSCPPLMNDTPRYIRTYPRRLGR
jgi:hypothetical protein